VGKPVETPSLFKNVVRPFLNRWSAVHKTREIFSLQSLEISACQN